MNIDTKGPWQMSKMTDNINIMFTYIHQRHCIQNHAQFLIWLDKLRRIEELDDFNQLINLKREILRYEELQYNPRYKTGS